MVCLLRRLALALYRTGVVTIAQFIITSLMI